MSEQIIEQLQRELREVQERARLDAEQSRLKEEQLQNQLHEAEKRLPAGPQERRDLDANWPNVSSHRTAEGGSRHAITADEFTGLVNEQFRQGQLAPYGYTFVAKGTIPAYYDRLKHESLVYARLERLQGEVMQVHLGITDLSWGSGFVIPGGTYLGYRMMMSWGGEAATYQVVPNLTAERNRWIETVWNEGVSHHPKFLWNEEVRRVMAINFDRPALRPPPKHKQLSALSRRDQKRKRRRGPDSDNQNQKRVSIGGSGLRLVE
ncbi:uncharacterized protein B0H64DRAFT_453742 [Chaetomium fimeti]|uniref:Uncharacterized protein n=1 Tax=Chaetomium fimeti TaxID=1854472 RepID=A0AAE0HKZ9_9PEZI|nr:hypothetical protein B0H64DRAFT_453742 [Chaetomium fimeti]